MSQQSYASVAEALVTGPGPRLQCDPGAPPNCRKIPPRPAARKTTARHPTAAARGDPSGGAAAKTTRHATPSRQRRRRAVLEVRPAAVPETPTTLP